LNGDEPPDDWSKSPQFSLANSTSLLEGTTPIDPEVCQAMSLMMRGHLGGSARGTVELD